MVNLVEDYFNVLLTDGDTSILHQILDKVRAWPAARAGRAARTQGAGASHCFLPVLVAPLAEHLPQRHGSQHRSHRHEGKATQTRGFMLPFDLQAAAASTCLALASSPSNPGRRPAPLPSLRRTRSTWPTCTRCAAPRRAALCCAVAFPRCAAWAAPRALVHRLQAWAAPRALVHRLQGPHKVLLVLICPPTLLLHFLLLLPCSPTPTIT